jgi:hypothetical protein
MEAVVMQRFTEITDQVMSLLPDDNKPGRVVKLVPGSEISWDDCCQGQLSARLAGLIPIKGAGANSPCGIDYWVATGELTMLRCSVALTSEAPYIPPPAVLEAEGSGNLTDSDLMLAVLLSKDWVKSITSWNPVGPNANSGGCRGISWNFTFHLDSPKLTP